MELNCDKKTLQENILKLKSEFQDTIKGKDVYCRIFIILVERNLISEVISRPALREN